MTGWCKEVLSDGYGLAVVLTNRYQKGLLNTDGWRVKVACHEAQIFSRSGFGIP